MYPESSFDDESSSFFFSDKDPFPWVGSGGHTSRIAVVVPDVDDKKKNRKTGFGFYSYIVVISIFTIGFFGVLNLAKDIITASYPVTEFYINYLYEVIGIIRIIIFELIN